MKKAHSGNHNRAMLSFAAFLAALAFTGFPGNSADRAARLKTTLRREVQPASPRIRLLIDDDWRFIRGDPPNSTATLNCDVRPQLTGRGGAPAVSASAGSAAVVKWWVLPTENKFLKDQNVRARRPEGNPGDGVPYAAVDFDDSSCQKLDLPHDYAIEGPFSRSMNLIHFEASGPGEIVATDNGDPTDMTPFPAEDRKAFNGLALAIIRAR
jgi:hypothetical protein